MQEHGKNLVLKQTMDIQCVCVRLWIGCALKSVCLWSGLGRLKCWRKSLVWAHQVTMGNWDCQWSDCACSLCARGWISVTQIALGVWLSQRSKCVTVIWTAETRRVLMSAQPPTPICLQSHTKAAPGEEKNVLCTGSDRCLFSCLDMKNILIHIYKYIFMI